MLQQLKVDPGIPIPLPAAGSAPRQVHVFEEWTIDAVNAALAARRPLLLRGEPGVGKSQLARAAAYKLGRPLVTEVVDSRTESRDVLYRFDAVARLGEAQLLGALRVESTPEKARERLHEKNFVAPGVLWWAFDWLGAREQLQRRQGEALDPKVPATGEPEAPQGWQPGQGVVVLVDEIDKAEADVPNGLLEALGENSFRSPADARSVEFKVGEPPLVIITTNEERALPDAFVRRCLVLHLSLPELPKYEARFIELLAERGAAHFSKLPKPLLKDAAKMLAEDRVAAHDLGLPLPGQAEYLDLLRVLATGFQATKQADALERIRAFTFRKHLAGSPDDRQSGE